MVDLSGYRLTFDDEFNTRSISQDGLGTTYRDIRPEWRYDANSDIGFGHSSFVDSASGYDPFSVEGGALTITAVPDRTGSGYPGSWESGLISTQGRFSQTYGYFEMRADLSSQIGSWDGLWMMPDNQKPDPAKSGGWQELDVVEHYGVNDRGTYSTIHTTDRQTDGVRWQDNRQVYSETPNPSGYHTYGVNWQSDKLSFYVDGALKGSQMTPSDMHSPMYMMANLAIQNGASDGSITSHIDYIRAYSKEPNAVAVTQGTVSAPDGKDPGMYGATAAVGTPAPTTGSPSNSTGAIGPTSGSTGSTSNLIGTPRSPEASAGTTRSTSPSNNAPCYCSETRISTDRGDVAVEELRIGDVVLTAAGQNRTILWIGTRRYPGISAPRADRPVRIKADALADGVPTRDLLVSPDHALYLDGLFVAAGHLVNGTSITRGEEVKDLTYWHVELDRHDLLLAENTPAESFLAAPGLRRQFDGISAADVESVQIPYAKRVEQGRELKELRRRLIIRAGLSVEPIRFGNLQGSLDLCEIHGGDLRVAGWARDAAHPNGPVCLDIIVDGAIAAMTLAEVYRPDLAAAGVGKGQYGFDIGLGGLPGLDQTQTVEVRRSADGVSVGAMRLDAAGVWKQAIVATPTIGGSL
ncbi:Hint domain-containing protein [Methylobacterium mesophilicum]